MAHARKELFDFVEYRVLVADKGKVVLARQLDELCAGNSLGNITALFDLETAVLFAVYDERRDAYRRQEVANIYLGIHLTLLIRTSDPA